jgi:hypothetical protein
MPRILTAACLLALAGLIGPSLHSDRPGRGQVQLSGNASSASDSQGGRSPVLAAGGDLLAELEMVRQGDVTDLYVSNRLAGPVQVELRQYNVVDAEFLPALPLQQVLPAGTRQLISRIQFHSPTARYHVVLSGTPGDPKVVIRDVSYSLPIDEQSDWHLGEGFHGGYSHDDLPNRYAVDLVAPEGSAVLAARSGIVMQTEDGFVEHGADRRKYADRANLIRILHDDGSMGLYAHLRAGGVLVRTGERVELGQHIGYSGNTGYSTGPHLHFAVQINNGMKLVSIPFRMVGPGGYLPLPR